MTNPYSAMKPRAVPSGRLSRLARLGGMASGIAGTMALDGARQFSQGKRPALRDLLLTPTNVTRVADQLARMRGAAMKVGQLMSMDAGEMLPPELADILARLRADADYMPPQQLKKVLNANWGPGWLARFAKFDVRPVAAASIGQVHRARTRDGRDLAIKVQYPGVRQSIDSDVTNVAGLIRMAGLIPDGLDIAPLLDEARRQLHEEADYQREGTQLSRFADLLCDAPDFLVPTLHADLTTENVLAMSFAPSEPVEAMTDAPQVDRDRIVSLLIGLLFCELFEFNLMQTDPNFANYRYDRQTGRVVLLDFGATRAFAAHIPGQYRALMRAGISGDRVEMHRATLDVGFYDETTDPRHQAMVLDMIDLAFEAMRHEGSFDFSDGALAARMHEAGMVLGAERDFVHIPPMDTLYLQRKFGGVYLLASRLKARVDVGALLAPYL